MAAWGVIRAIAEGGRPRAPRDRGARRFRALPRAVRCVEAAAVLPTVLLVGRAYGPRCAARYLGGLTTAGVAQTLRESARVLTRGRDDT